MPNHTLGYDWREVWFGCYTGFDMNLLADGSAVVLLRVLPEEPVQPGLRLSQLQSHLQLLRLLHLTDRREATRTGLLRIIPLPRYRVSRVSIRGQVPTGNFFLYFLKKNVGTRSSFWCHWLPIFLTLGDCPHGSQSQVLLECTLALLECTLAFLAHGARCQQVRFYFLHSPSKIDLFVGLDFTLRNFKVWQLDKKIEIGFGPKTYQLFVLPSRTCCWQCANMILDT